MINPDMFLALSCSLMHDISKVHASLTFHGPWVYSDTELDAIFSWAIMYSNCNTFFDAKSFPYHQSAVGRFMRWDIVKSVFFLTDKKPCFSWQSTWAGFCVIWTEASYLQVEQNQPSSNYTATISCLSSSLSNPAISAMSSANFSY